MTKIEFDKEVQDHVSSMIKDADQKHSSDIAQKKLAKHKAKVAKTNSLNRSSMNKSTSSGIKIAEEIIAKLQEKHS